MPPSCWPRRRGSPPLALAGELAELLAGARRHRAGRAGTAGLRQPDHGAGLLAAAGAGDPGGRPPTTAAARSGRGSAVNVEFCSANPTGPLHVGHGRGTVFGDALASVLAHAGYAVTREYYVNDGGAQIETLARSLHLRYREALGETIGEIPAGPLSGRLSDAGGGGDRRARRRPLARRRRAGLAASRSSAWASRR